ncbi:MAG TPA: hypothetical protein VGR73_01590 [Bryobacteraceae bacterium]|nr:hypothetical protein [Bryobacteraceae bacterium]
MRRVALILLSIAAAAAADKDKARYAPGRASSYAGNQTLDKITIAAVPFATEDQAHLAFDKVNPNKYGVLPVLVVMDNGTGKALRLELKAEFVTADKQHLEATPPEDVIYIDGVRKPPKLYHPNPVAVAFPKHDKKGPLNVWEIPGRAFNAKLIPPGESVSGFFYFQTAPEPGSHLYLTGVKDAASGQDYFYFEVPIEKQ